MAAFNKKRSVVTLTILSIFIVLMIIFGVVKFPMGKVDYNGYARTIKKGLDLSGGVSAVYKVTDPENNKETFQSRLEGTKSSLLSLLVSKGYTEAQVTISTQGENTYLRVEVPDVDDPAKVLDLIGRPQTLEFKKEDKADAEAQIRGREHLESAYVTQDNDGRYAVGLQFNGEGKKAFAKLTKETVNKNTYIYINKEKYTTVKVNSVINDGKAIITSQNGYTYEEAKEFATKLQAGALGVNLQVTEVKNISPTLGNKAIERALIAGGVGILLVFIFMAAIYRGMGIAADISLLVYTLLLLWLLAVLPWVQLTLPGIAGVLLSIGMAVDANIIIFERIKDEFRFSKKPIMPCIDVGFKRSLGAIIDGNITTLIGAIVLWIIGSSAIKGFAITLFLGIIVSMFTALVVSRAVLKSLVVLKPASNKFFALKRSKDLEEIEDNATEEQKLKEVPNEG